MQEDEGGSGSGEVLYVAPEAVEVVYSGGEEGEDDGASLGSAVSVGSTDLRVDVQLQTTVHPPHGLPPFGGMPPPSYPGLIPTRPKKFATVVGSGADYPLPMGVSGVLVHSTQTCPSVGVQSYSQPESSLFLRPNPSVLPPPLICGPRWVLVSSPAPTPAPSPAPVPVFDQDIQVEVTRSQKSPSPPSSFLLDETSTDLDEEVPPVAEVAEVEAESLVMGSGEAFDQMERGERMMNLSKEPGRLRKGLGF